MNTLGLRIYQQADSTRTEWEALQFPPLAEGEVLIAIYYSSINYKDALAATGRAKILRKSPLVGGIDLAGEVVASTTPEFATGDMVLANGSGLSETLDGGYATHAKLPASIVVPIPQNLNARNAMIIGTAGFTAALAIMRMERNGQTPDMGQVLVTGASGGVGSFAVSLLHHLGYSAVASTRKQNATDYLMKLGATEVIAPIQAVLGDLGKAHWAGGIDSLGGETLVSLLKTAKPHSNIVSIGLAQSSKLEASVMPFIIRGVNLLGVTSANCPMPIKKSVWEALATRLLLSQECLDAILSQEVPLSELKRSDHFEQVLKGGGGVSGGRILVNCQV